MEIYEPTRKPAARAIFTFIIIMLLSNCFVNFQKVEMFFRLVVCQILVEVIQKITLEKSCERESIKLFRKGSSVTSTAKS